MKESPLEPGLIRVFQWYAWLRFISLAIIPLLGIRASFREGFTFDVTTPVIVTVVDILVLLVYLYLPGLERKLGGYFFPIAIVIASATLLLEQYLFLNQAAFLLHFAFMFVLLILVAWQYRFRVVVFYSLGIAVVEVVLSFISPQTLVYPVMTPEIQRMINVGLIFSRTIIFLVLGYVVTTLMKDQRAQRRALAEANRKLVQHAATLEQLTISRERNRISRELHDTLAHTLSAQAVQLEALETVWNPLPDRARELIDQMLETTRSGLDEARRTLSALRASPLEEMGLALAVSSMAQDFASRNALTLELDVPDDMDDLPPEIEQCYYRVAQEALENTAKHAAADVVTLHMVQNSQGIDLTIKDDGTGFDVQEVTADYGGKFGMRGMQERAELIGAQLSIESQPGVGTSIRLHMENDR